MGVDLYVFTPSDESSQIAVGRWDGAQLPDAPADAESAEIADERTVVVVTYPRETRVWEDRSDGIRLEVVGRSVDTSTLRDVLAGLRYDPALDD
jgi:hypothetical protein